MAPSDNVIHGVIALTVGLIFAVTGTLLWRDSWGLLTKYYGRTIRSWRRVPFLGERWIEQTPFSQFRRQTLPLIVGGVVFVALGIFTLVRSL